MSVNYNVLKDKKLPALQFYPGDWRKDIGVQSLTFHDRGVWFEMLMLMHDSERRGVLVLNGNAMSDEAIARAIGLDNQIFNQTLTTLLTSGVAEREQTTGAICNRRMIRDEHLRKIRAEAGSKGGNPALLNQNLTTPVKQNPTPSSSSSPSISKEAYAASSEAKDKAATEGSSLLPEMAAKGVMDRTRLFTKDLLEILTKVMRSEANAGEDLETLSDRMVNAWEEYKKAQPNLKIHPGADKFFGSGYWSNQAGWSWKEGHAPQGRRVYANT